MPVFSSSICRLEGSDPHATAIRYGAPLNPATEGACIEPSDDPFLP